MQYLYTTKGLIRPHGLRKARQSLAFIKDPVKRKDFVGNALFVVAVLALLWAGLAL